MSDKTYTLVKTISSPDATVRVFSPNITEEERAKRMKQIHKAAEQLLKSAMGVSK